MNLIVAVDENWAIGKDNKLLVSIPSDMKFFRETTTGKVKDFRKLSQRAAAKEQDKHCTYQKP